MNKKECKSSACAHSYGFYARLEYYNETPDGSIKFHVNKSINIDKQTDFQLYFNWFLPRNL